MGLCGPSRAAAEPPLRARVALWVVNGESGLWIRPGRGEMRQESGFKIWLTGTLTLRVGAGRICLGMGDPRLELPAMPVLELGEAAPRANQRLGVFEGEAGFSHQVPG